MSDTPRSISPKAFADEFYEHIENPASEYSELRGIFSDLEKSFPEGLDDTSLFNEVSKRNPKVREIYQLETSRPETTVAGGTPPSPERAKSSGGFSDLLHKAWNDAVVNPIKQLGAGYFSSAAGGAHLLNNFAVAIERTTGMPRGKAFEQARDYYAAKAAELAGERTDLPSEIYRGVGAVPGEVAKYTAATAAAGGNPIAGMALAEAASEADKGVMPALMAGAHGAALGATLRVMGPATRPIKAAGGAALGALPAAASGASPEQIVASGLTMAGLTAQHSGTVGPREIRANLGIPGARAPRTAPPPRTPPPPPPPGAGEAPAKTPQLSKEAQSILDVATREAQGNPKYSLTTGRISTILGSSDAKQNGAILRELLQAGKITSDRKLVTSAPPAVATQQAASDAAIQELVQTYVPGAAGQGPVERIPGALTERPPGPPERLTPAQRTALEISVRHKVPPSELFTRLHEGPVELIKYIEGWRNSTDPTVRSRYLAYRELLDAMGTEPIGIAEVPPDIAPGEFTFPKPEVPPAPAAPPPPPPPETTAQWLRRPVRVGELESVPPSGGTEIGARAEKPPAPPQVSGPPPLPPAEFEAAKQRIMERFQELMSNTSGEQRFTLDPQILKDVMTVAPELARRAGRGMEGFRQAMLDAFGEKIQGYIPMAWQQARIPYTERPPATEGVPRASETPPQARSQAGPVVPPAQPPVSGKFSSTQVDLDKPLADRARSIGRMISRKDLAPDGLEPDVHITAKYGIHSQDPGPVQQLLAEHGPVTGTIGKLKLFRSEETGNPFDVLVAEVDSPQLHDLNAKIEAGVPHTKTFPTYDPHVTIAYLKPGMGEKYLKLPNPLEGQQFTSNEIQFSAPTDARRTGSGRKTAVRLFTPPPVPEPVETLAPEPAAPASSRSPVEPPLSPTEPKVKPAEPPVAAAAGGPGAEAGYGSLKEMGTGELAGADPFGELANQYKFKERERVGESMRLVSDVTGSRRMRIATRPMARGEVAVTQDPATGRWEAWRLDPRGDEFLEREGDNLTSLRNYMWEIDRMAMPEEGRGPSMRTGQMRTFTPLAPEPEAGTAPPSATADLRRVIQSIPRAAEIVADRALTEAQGLLGIGMSERAIKLYEPYSHPPQVDVKEVQDIVHRALRRAREYDAIAEEKRTAPPDRIAEAVGEVARQSPDATDEDIARIISAYVLDRPVPEATAPPPMPESAKTSSKSTGAPAKPRPKLVPLPKESRFETVEVPGLEGNSWTIIPRAGGEPVGYIRKSKWNRFQIVWGNGQEGPVFATIRAARIRAVELADQRADVVAGKRGRGRPKKAATSTAAPVAAAPPPASAPPAAVTLPVQPVTPAPSSGNRSARQTSTGTAKKTPAPPKPPAAATPPPPAEPGKLAKGAVYIPDKAGADYGFITGAPVEYLGKSGATHEFRDLETGSLVRMAAAEADMLEVLKPQEGEQRGPFGKFLGEEKGEVDYSRLAKILKEPFAGPAGGAWVSPRGDVVPVARIYEQGGWNTHEKRATEILDVDLKGKGAQQRAIQGWAAAEKLMKMQWVRQRNNSVEALQGAEDSPAFEQAVRLAVKDAKESGDGAIHVDLGIHRGMIQLKNIDEFLLDPGNYIRRYKLIGSAAPPKMMDESIAAMA